MRTALILEGGAMRGMFSCGVTDVLMERGITFDGMAGISAGAVFGCNVKSGQIGRAIRYNKRYGTDPRYCSLRSLIRTGDLYGADFCYRELPDVLDPFDREAFRRNPMAFYVGATDIKTGEAVYHRCDDGSDEDLLWMRASASMPIASRPVAVGGRLLLDGGMVDAVPCRYMQRLGYDRLLIVLTQPKGYVKRKTRGMPLFRLALRGYPNAVRAMAVRHERYNRQMAEIDALEASGAAFVVRPPEPLGIKRTEKRPGELERVYQIGRAEMARRIDALKAFLTAGGA